MRNPIRLILAVAVSFAIIGATPVAAAASPADGATVVTVRTGHSPREAASAMGLAVTADTTCDWVNVTLSRSTVYTVNARLDWCHNGYAVGGHGTWSATAHGVYYFSHWTNPPNDYYDAPGYQTIHTVGQAKFCTAWCSISFNPGVNIWGNADGTYGVAYL